MSAAANNESVEHSTRGHGRRDFVKQWPVCTSKALSLALLVVNLHTFLLGFTGLGWAEYCRRYLRAPASSGSSLQQYGVHGSPEFAWQPLGEDELPRYMEACLLARLEEGLGHGCARLADLVRGWKGRDAALDALGISPAEGPGICLRLYDAPEGYGDAQIVHAADVLKVVHILFGAGATAIAVGGHRWRLGSCLECVGPIMRLDGRPLAVDPVIVEAVGPPESLLRASSALGEDFAGTGKILYSEKGTFRLPGGSLPERWGAASERESRGTTIED